MMGGLIAKTRETGVSERELMGWDASGGKTGERVRV
jgi:hypothetical protein